MTLMELLRDLPLTSGAAAAASRETAAELADLRVSGITHDSRRVEDGDLFVALIGQHHDGRVFAAEAAERGAVAVLGPGEAPAGLTVPWLRSDRPRDLLGPLAARLYGHPDRELLTAGVTGTNGKSTVVALLASLFEADGRPAARLGTLGYVFRDLSFEGERTTPEASDLFRTLRRMRDAGARAVAMEVSSHALELGRVRGLGFDLALFTNLSRDHFDFHSDYESYFEAKRSLFAQLRDSGTAVVNVGDAHGRRLAGELPRVVAYGPGGDVSCEEAELDRHGIRARLATPRGALRITSRLLGSYNLENLVAAAAAGEALGLPHATIAEGLAACAPLPGRMEPVEAGQPFPALIDFAHTDAALEAAIRSLRDLAGGRVIVVFGCGGDRDPGKRALMGRVAGQLADLPIATSDNPRGEDPMAILAAVEEGLRQSGNRAYRVLPDRREAIRQAVAKAGRGWAVLVAGKGHEEVQIVGDRRLPFSDRAELRQALEERFGAGTTG